MEQPNPSSEPTSNDALDPAASPPPQPPPPASGKNKFRTAVIIQLIVKGVAWFFLLLAFSVGTHAHIYSVWLSSAFLSQQLTCEKVKAELEAKPNPEIKPLDFESCVEQIAKPLEIVFCIITGLLFFISLGIIILEVIMEFMGKPLSKKLDALCCFVVGILMVIAGILIIVAGILINGIKDGLGGNALALAGFNANAGLFPTNKFAAGALSIIDTIIWIVAGVFVCKDNGGGEGHL